MAGPTARLSSALLVADMNDFLSPAQACVLPMGGGATAEPAGSVLAPIIPRAPAKPVANTKAEPEAPPSAAKATITLSDCLSCSGCVTSAETVLLSSAHVEKLRAELLSAPAADRAELFAVAFLSQQAVSSLAVRFDLSLHSCARRVAHFLTDSLGFDAVVDAAAVERLIQRMMANEFVERFRAGKAPVVCSACPGWVTYAEKTQDEIVLSAISSVRSAQAAFGALARQTMKHEDGRRIWLASVAPCHDKKIEAARPEFADGAGAPEVDCVLTSGEVVELMEEKGCDLREEAEGSLHTGDATFGKHAGSGSGGYADFVLRHAASEILGVTLPDGKLEWKKASRSGDLQSVSVMSADGSKELKFALAYGFRSLQSILRKMRRGECAFDYIELMACPGGCNNGGGQLPLVIPEGLRTDDARAMKAANSALLQQVQDAFFSAPDISSAEGDKMVDAFLDIVEDSKGLKTNIVSRKSSTPGSLAW